MKLCSVSGCGLKVEGYSPLCNTHKRALQRHGHPLMKGVEASELKPYRQIIAQRTRRNANNPVWEILRANWAALADHSRAYHAGMQRGEPYNRTDARVHQEVIKLDISVASEDIANVVMALYLYRKQRPTRFPSEEAFRFQLVRRVMRLTEVNVGVSFNQSTQRAVRVYRDLPPRATRRLGQFLIEVYGAAGEYVAGLEAAEKARATVEKVKLHDALEALV